MSREAEPSAPSSDEIGFDEFLRRFRDTERAWALLDEASLTEAVERGARSSAVLVRAAEMLAGLGRASEARAALEQALALDGPTAPAQIAYARQIAAAGDVDSARKWFRGGLARARPAIALMLEYAAFEQEAGESDYATRIAETIDGLAPGTASDLMAIGRRLAALRRPDLAGKAFAGAYRRGHRGDDLMRLIVATDDGATGPLAAPINPSIPGGPTIREAAASMLAHGKLAASALHPASVALAQARETSPRWVQFERLNALLRERIARREPFSWIRLSDGEARFLLHARPDVGSGLDDAEVRSIVGLIWSIWFGQPFEKADPIRVDEIGDALEAAIQNAGLLGVTSAERLIGDQQHRGYCAALERYLETLSPKEDQLFTDAGFNLRLNEGDPFLGTVLSGLDFLGLISPHPDLGSRLRRHLGIAEGVSYDIPGEGRLGRDRERGNRGLHFPAIYDRLMTELAVPFRGAVFLVAGGLLGKLYCERIRALGGIALDVGALADAWVGLNTRGTPLDLSMRAVLPA